MNNKVKCSYCGSKFNKNNVDHVKENGKYYEIECFKAQKKSLKRQIWTDKDVENKILILKAKMTQENAEKEQKTRENQLKEQEKAKFHDGWREFGDYITEAYEITKISQYTWNKLRDIVEGVNMLEPISYHDLLFIFKRKRSQLDMIYDKKVARGNNMSKAQRLNYDIAVVVGMYDEYKSWKRKQEILAIDVQKNISDKKGEVKINYSKVSKINKTDDEGDISDFLGDIG